MTLLTVKVVPGASKDEIVGWLGDDLKIRVRAAPEKGKANKAVLKILAKRLGLASHQLEITDGHTSPYKKISVDGVTLSELRTILVAE